MAFLEHQKLSMCVCVCACLLSVAAVNSDKPLMTALFFFIVACKTSWKSLITPMPSCVRNCVSINDTIKRPKANCVDF